MKSETRGMAQAMEAGPLAPPVFISFRSSQWLSSNLDFSKSRTCAQYSSLCQFKPKYNPRLRRATLPACIERPGPGPKPPLAPLSFSLTSATRVTTLTLEEI